MKKNVHIGDVSIPLQSYAIGGTALLGIRGSGKTWAAKGIAEQLLDAHIPIIVFDPIGVWRFLKMPANKGGKGYEVVVAGGRGADLPLTPQSAPEIVRAAMRENIPLVIDLYDKSLSKADWRRIVQSSFRTLLYENEGVRHIFLEEAAEYCPQKVQDGETYAEVEKLVRMGGNASLGITLINQRAQEVNKAVLDLCENLVLMRQMGAHAIEALEKWIDKVSPDFAREIAAGMPKMQAGEAWVFAGGAERPVHTKTPAIRTYHPDRKNPDAKVTASATDTSAFVDAMQKALPAIVEQQRANDPAALRKQIAELQRQVAQEATRPAGATREDLKAAEARGFEKGHAAGAAEAQKVAVAHLRSVKSAAHQAMESAFGAALPALPSRPTAAPAVTSAARAQRVPVVAPRKTGANRHGEPLPKGEAATLAACIQYPDGLRREQLTVLTAYKRSSRDAYIQRLRERGYVEVSGDLVRATPEGCAALPDAEPLPTGEALQEFWRAKLPEGERKILDVLISEYPNAVERAELDTRTNYQRSSRDAYLQRLRAKQLIEEPGRGEVRASRELFA